MRCVGWSFAALTLTAVLQAVVVVVSGSVALLGDTLHNFADALTAVPLAVAFLLGRRAATRRYTYGFGRAEDLAGLVVVVLIAALGGRGRLGGDPAAARPAGGDRPAAGRGRGPGRLRRQRVGGPVSDPGRPADRLGGAGRRRPARPHRRVHLAWPCCWAPAESRSAGPAADPIVGLLITVAIAAGAARRRPRGLPPADGRRRSGAGRRGGDRRLRATPGVVASASVRLRWIGHALRAEVRDRRRPPADRRRGPRDRASTPSTDSLHDVPRLFGALVHANPGAGADADAHDLVAHHR